MKILFFADLVFEDLPGGSRVVARELAGGLVRRGHTVTFLVRSKDSEFPLETCMGGARVVRFAASGSALGYVRAGREACARLLTEDTYDIVHTHFAYGALGPLKAVSRTVPHIRTFHGPWHAEGMLEDRKALEDRQQQGGGLRQAARCAATFAVMHLKYALRALIERHNLRRSRVAIVLSEQTRGEVLALNFPAAKIVKIIGGVDTVRFLPADNKESVRAALGLPLDRTLLLSVRRLAPRMGLDNLIKAMPAIIARQPQVLLLIGGQGPEKARLEALVTELSLAAHVRLLGFIPDDQLVSYYQAADAFVLPTVALEGFGLVTAEALACGIPVLGTAVGATPEILSRIDKRLIVPNSSPSALAASVLDFLEGSWGRELTPTRLRRLVLDHYQWDKHVEAVEQLYAEMIGPSPASQRIEKAPVPLSY